MVRRRGRCIEVDGLNKGTWTEEEDAKLAAYVRKYGHDNWRLLPKLADLKRCGKSCRLRWINYLSPNVKRGNFTKEEEEEVIRLHALLGNKWSKIASHLPGRTDNEIKNMWHTYLKKGVQDGDGKSSSNALSRKMIKTGRVTQAVYGINGAAAAVHVGPRSAAGLNEEILARLKSCQTHAICLGTKEPTDRCMEQGQSPPGLSSVQELKSLTMESCVTSPELLHDQLWPPQQQVQQYLYDPAEIWHDDVHCQLMEMYSHSVDPEEVWKHMEVDDDYLQLPTVAPDHVLIDTVQAGAVDGCSIIKKVPAAWDDQEQGSISSGSCICAAEMNLWLEYLEKELEL